MQFWLEKIRIFQKGPFFYIRWELSIAFFSVSFFSCSYSLRLTAAGKIYPCSQLEQLSMQSTINFKQNSILTRKNRNISKRPILLYPMGVVHCLFFCFFLFLFLFASTDSGRQNSICWGQQLQKMRESYSFLCFFLSKNTTEFSVLSLIFLGLHDKVGETIESLYF